MARPPYARRPCLQSKQLPDPLRLLAGTYNIVCRRFGDPNTLPLLYVSLVFIRHFTFYPDAIANVAPPLPIEAYGFDTKYITALICYTFVISLRRFTGSSSSSSPERRAAS